MIPALLKMMSRPPQASSFSIAACTSDSLETSTLVVSTLPTAFGASDFAFAIAFSKAGSEMSVINTLAPSRRNRIVVSRPMPLSRTSARALLHRSCSRIEKPACASPTSDSWHNAFFSTVMIDLRHLWRHLPSGSGDDGVLACQTTTRGFSIGRPASVSLSVHCFHSFQNSHVVEIVCVFTLFGRSFLKW